MVGSEWNVVVVGPKGSDGWPFFITGILYNHQRLCVYSLRNVFYVFCKHSLRSRSGGGSAGGLLKSMRLRLTRLYSVWPIDGVRMK